MRFIVAYLAGVLTASLIFFGYIMMSRTAVIAMSLEVQVETLNEMLAIRKALKEHDESVDEPDWRRFIDENEELFVSRVRGAKGGRYFVNPNTVSEALNTVNGLLVVAPDWGPPPEVGHSIFFSGGELRGLDYFRPVVMCGDGGTHKMREIDLARLLARTDEGVIEVPFTPRP